MGFALTKQIDLQWAMNDQSDSAVFGLIRSAHHVKQLVPCKPKHCAGISEALTGWKLGNGIWVIRRNGFGICIFLLYFGTLQLGRWCAQNPVNLPIFIYFSHFPEISKKFETNFMTWHVDKPMIDFSQMLLPFFASWPRPLWSERKAEIW